jgi:hypothetical protein
MFTSKSLRGQGRNGWGSRGGVELLHDITCDAYLWYIRTLGAGILLLSWVAILDVISYLLDKWRFRTDVKGARGLLRDTVTTKSPRTVTNHKIRGHTC